MSLLWELLASIPKWERSSQMSLLFAVIFLIGVLCVAAADATLRTAALISAIGLVIIIQIIFLWGNRSMVTAYTQAQRAYLKGDFDQVRRLLETEQHDYRALTLLGNTYRQLGMLPESEAALRRALDKESLHHFPLYGFGRTLLAEGRYADAVQVFEQALRAGAPKGAQFDLAEAYYRLAQYEQALPLFQSVRPLLDEPYRALMAQHLLHQHGAAPRPSADLLREGMAFWERAAALFQQTPYGAALANDLRIMQTY